MLPLVLVPGLGCSAPAMAPIADHFAATRSVACVDLYDVLDDRSWPTPPRERTTIGGAAHEVLAQAARSVGGPFVLVAHSWGSRVAMQAWMDRPDLVRALVLIDDSRMGGDALLGHPLRARTAFLDRVGGDDAVMTQFLLGFIDDCFVTGCTPDWVREDMTAQMRRLPPDWARAAFVSVAEWDTGRLPAALEALARASVPLLLVQATFLDADFRRASLHSAEQSPWIAEVRGIDGDVDVAVVKQSGHFVQLEHPREVNERIASWLALSVDGHVDPPGSDTDEEVQ